VPFVAAVLMFVLAFAGLAYSLFPYLVMDRITIWDATAAPASLRFIGVGVMITLPVIVGYTITAYRVFWGRSTALSYD
jgi:cytochrome d ubiquinol oxidase subunit II